MWAGERAGRWATPNTKPLRPRSAGRRIPTVAAIVARVPSYRSTPCAPSPSPQPTITHRCCVFPGPPTSPPTVTPKARFAWPEHDGDQRNFWYVALTRAKNAMAVPAEFMHLLQVLQGPAPYPLDQTDAPPEAHAAVYEQLVVPWQRETLGTVPAGIQVVPLPPDPTLGPTTPHDPEPEATPASAARSRKRKRGAERTAGSAPAAGPGTCATPESAPGTGPLCDVPCSSTPERQPAGQTQSRRRGSTKGNSTKGSTKGKGMSPLTKYFPPQARTSVPIARALFPAFHDPEVTRLESNLECVPDNTPSLELGPPLGSCADPIAHQQFGLDHSTRSAGLGSEFNRTPNADLRSMPPADPAHQPEGDPKPDLIEPALLFTSNPDPSLGPDSASACERDPKRDLAPAPQSPCDHCCRSAAQQQPKPEPEQGPTSPASRKGLPIMPTDLALHSHAPGPLQPLGSACATHVPCDNVTGVSQAQELTVERLASFVFAVPQLPPQAQPQTLPHPTPCCPSPSPPPPAPEPPSRSPLPSPRIPVDHTPGPTRDLDCNPNLNMASPEPSTRDPASQPQDARSTSDPPCRSSNTNVKPDTKRKPKPGTKRKAVSLGDDPATSDPNLTSTPVAGAQTHVPKPKPGPQPVPGLIHPKKELKGPTKGMSPLTKYFLPQSLSHTQGPS